MFFIFRSAVLLLALVVFLSSALAAEPQPIQALLFGGGDSHTFAQDVRAWIEFVKEKQCNVTYTESIEDINEEMLDSFDVLILHCCRNHPSNPNPIPETFKESLVKFVSKGKGIVFLHCSVASFSEWADYINLTGGIWKWGQSQHDKYQIVFSTVVDTKHPVTQDLPAQFEFPDEFYHTLQIQPTSKILIEGTHQKNNETVREPLAWIGKDSDKERTISLVFGHDTGAWNHPVFRTLLQNSIEWAAFRR